jgi:cytosine/adenosine deaminase-related metal-dependent hydrolase
MRRHRILTGLGLAWLAAAPLAQAAVDTAFVDVRVVPMEDSRVLEHQTVLVQGRRIVALGPVASTVVPKGSQRIEGHGTAYLVPGLADMHTHVMATEDLALYTANGVTTILHMGGAPAELVAGANADVDSGQRVGPHAFFALMIDGSADLQHFFVSTPQQGRDAVGLARSNGYDFIKLYNNVTAPEFEAIVAAAREQHMAVIGHGVRAVGLPRALFEGQTMVAHAEEFYYTAFQNQPDTARIPEVVAETARSGAFVTPNLSTFEAISRQWGKPDVVSQFLHDPRAHLMSPAMRLNWQDMDYARRSGNLDAQWAFLRTFTKALHDAGVPLLTGTDSPVIPGMYPGYSMHEDLRTLVEAGLSPYEALRAATRTPGEFIAQSVPGAEPFGMVKVGMKADLVLVEHNPLENLETLRSPLGVMSAGRWRSRDELSALLAMQKAKYDALLQ